MARSDTVNVLIVDDDRAIQRMLADALTRQGFTVTVERDGEWAVKTFEKKPFDAVILDLLLPGLNGYEVARKMRGTPKGRKTPIIMVSGVYKNALHQKEAVQKHGAFAFIEKPMKLQTLYDTLKSALGDGYPKPASKTVQIPATPAPSATEGADGVTDRFADPTAQEEVTHVERASQSVSHFQSIRGNFAQKPFPEVLAEVYRWKGTGALLLRRDKVKKIVYFRDGFPQSIKSNLLSECLGRIMVGERMISEAECDESLRRMKASNRQQGTVLIEMGCISPHNLNYALNLQLQVKLWDVFRWDEGDYQFNPRVMPPADPVNLEMSAAAVIYEGIRKSYDEERLRKVAGELSNLYVHPSENPLYALQDTGVGEEEQQILQATDGHKTVSTLRALALLPPHETNLFVWAMKCAQIVELKPTAAEGKPRISIPKMAAVQAQAAAVPPPLPPPMPERASPPPPPTEAMHWEAPPGEMDDERDLPPPPVPDERPSNKRGPLLPGIAAPKTAKGAASASASSDDERPSKSRGPVKARAVGSLLPELSGVHSPSSAEDSLLRERLAAKVAAMRKQDYFEILGLPTTAGREDIKRSYFAMAKEYHPDKHFGSSSAEVRQLAAQIYDLISTAHDTLTDPVERERYVKEIASGVKRDIGDEVGKILAAEGRFQKGEELMRQRQYEAARKLFEEAIQLYDQEGEFHAWLGWSMFQANPEDAHNADAALRALEKAVSLNPKMDKSYLFTGYIFKATGRPDKAEKQFEKAIQCNPDCTEALRELRLLGRARR